MNEVCADAYRIAFKTIKDPEDSELASLLCADHAVVFICSGTWDVSLENMEFALREGSVLLKNAQEKVSLFPCRSNKDYTAFVIGIWGRIPKPKDGAECYDLYSVLEGRPRGAYNICSSQKVSELGIRMVAWNLMTLKWYDFKSPTKRDLIVEWTYFLLFTLRKSLPDVFRESESPVHKILAYVNDHIDEELSAKELGKRFFLSPNHLNAIFKKETGVSLHQYIINQRVKMANNLMDQGLSVTEIASCVGYKSYQGFYQAYQQVMNMSPAEYAARKK